MRSNQHGFDTSISSELQYIEYVIVGRRWASMARHWPGHIMNVCTKIEGMNSQQYLASVVFKRG